jgi:hypothetical protein
MHATVSIASSSVSTALAATVLDVAIRVSVRARGGGKGGLLLHPALRLPKKKKKPASLAEKKAKKRKGESKVKAKKKMRPVQMSGSAPPIIFGFGYDPVAITAAGAHNIRPPMLPPLPAYRNMFL